MGLLATALLSLLGQHVVARVVSVEIELHDSLQYQVPCKGYRRVICSEEDPRVVLCIGCGNLACCASAIIHPNSKLMLLNALEHIKATSTDYIFANLVSEAIQQVVQGQLNGRLLYIPPEANISEHEALMLFDRALKGEEEAKQMLQEIRIRILAWAIRDNKIFIKGWEQ